jgi:ferredoxin
VTQKFLSHAGLGALVAKLVAADTSVIAPVRAKEDDGRIEYAPIRQLSDAAFGVQLPHRSLKQHFLPATEVLLEYRRTKENVELREAPTKAKPCVFLGASPCDAAALEVVDRVMGWDYRDELWFGRREAHTIVALLCSVTDANCFCRAVGHAPDSTRGADVFLTPVEGGYLAQMVTSKGVALLQGFGEEASSAMLAAAEKAKSEARKRVEANLAAIPTELAVWLAKNFDHPLWKTIALRCHGCGACAALCPTCHCFDIVDEHDGAEEGARRRNWDSCQTAKFTVHASGHNPRASQSERFRQRIQHKFSIYPSRFGEILCTGCGRCSRNCPAGMDLPEMIGKLVAKSQSTVEVKEP